MSLLNVIKTAGLQAVQAENPVNVFHGTVTSESPLTVLVDQRFTITREFLIVPESMSRYETDLQHVHGASEPALGTIVIRPGIQNGDKLILLRLQGGQKFLVLDKEAMT